MKKNTKLPERKLCNKCGVVKPAKDYTRRGRFLLNAFCKICRVKLATEWRLKNKEKYRKYHKDYYHKNK